MPICNTILSCISVAISCFLILLFCFYVSFSFNFTVCQFLSIMFFLSALKWIQWFIKVKLLYGSHLWKSYAVESIRLSRLCGYQTEQFMWISDWAVYVDIRLSILCGYQTEQFMWISDWAVYVDIRLSSLCGYQTDQFMWISDWADYLDIRLSSLSGYQTEQFMWIFYHFYWPTTPAIISMS